MPQLAYLAEHPRASGAEVRSHLKVCDNTMKTVILRLFKAGKLWKCQRYVPVLGVHGSILKRRNYWEVASEREA